MNLTINKEDFTDSLYQEILPLAKRCWAESTEAKGKTCAFYGERDFDIEPDLDQYKRLAQAGSMVIITLRNAYLRGYASGFIYRSLHHKKIIGGIGDTIYVEPEYRSYTGPVIDRFLQEMSGLRAGIIGWPVTPESPVHKLLIARGFVGDDVVMEKRLCVSPPPS